MKRGKGEWENILADPLHKLVSGTCVLVPERPYGHIFSHPKLTNAMMTEHCDHRMMGNAVFMKIQHFHINTRMKK